MRLALRKRLDAVGVESLDELVALIGSFPGAVVVFDGNCAEVFMLDGWGLAPHLRRNGWTGEGVALTGKRDENVPLFQKGGIATERVFEKPASQEFWELIVELAK